VTDDATPRNRQSGPGGNKVLAGLLLLEHADAIVPTDETLVSMALNPMWVTDHSEMASVNAGFTALLRTAGYFILDIEQVHEALMSEPPEGMPAFPPLPFKRVWIEAHRVGRGPVPYMLYDQTERYEHGVRIPETRIEVLGVGIVEVTARHVWDVYVPYRLTDRRSRLVVGAYRITPNEILMPRLDIDTDIGLRNLLMMAVNGAHLITAKNVPHREVVLPRAQRRGMDRGFKYPPRIPKLYFVDLAESGEIGEARPSGRTYRVRWLVMGHERHIPGGDHLCTCWDHRHNPQLATWIPPHVKGPAGAPWKGRPVHRQRAA